ncbi:flavodoxin family protein [Companilactobacillus bobalius]|uniref:NADPH-dependent FMN reductase-like domain-containing protein n=2 Tax=Companilactobacillus bobalius TaxID=2801451 RepID=A0A202FCH9_9LACO|nr:NAD(P)H-dependent oxidoreductase [Companilactobacillus bobalius]GEO58546.1 FMN reductase [Companilactobacillus paralimentarius]KAE9557517.1 NADPH-dependent FMN reductase [Companilactobacillus bobalius]KAE9561588.1 NADPH-dependent FMN reductase [Companilactobacillus bobalius]KAE9563664.1 NADPH-dependent FMN reductase [Companilactobacillus bobalius]KRK82487.1 NADPH-dependent FMN reductase [Companilactobacillus bobalius DSM 19674]
MKILGILASHQEHGLNAQMLDEVLKNVDSGIETETIFLENYDITPHKYHEDNPVLDELAQKLMDSDVWIFAAPTYWRELSGVLKNFFDCMRPKFVYFKQNGDTIPGPFKNKHYLSISSCYVSILENFVTGVTDDSFKTIDRVMSAAGVIKVGEIVLPNTFGMKTIPYNKKKLCQKYAKKISVRKRKDDSTVKRYIQLFFMIAVMALITMGIQLPLSGWIGNNFWLNYTSFTIIFFVLLACILHFVTFVKHRRR